MFRAVRLNFTHACELSEGLVKMRTLIQQVWEWGFQVMSLLLVTKAHFEGPRALPDGVSYKDQGDLKEKRHSF